MTKQKQPWSSYQPGEPYRAWYRQPNEPARCYEAFQFYLHQGPERTIASAHQSYVEEKAKETLVSSKKTSSSEDPREESKAPSRKAGPWYRWSGEWRWSERAKEYDAYQIEQRRRAKEKADAKEAETWARRQKEFRDRLWGSALDLQKGVAQALSGGKLTRNQVSRMRTVQPNAAAGQGTPVAPEVITETVVSDMERQLRMLMEIGEMLFGSSSASAGSREVEETMALAVGEVTAGKIVWLEPDLPEEKPIDVTSSAQTSEQRSLPQGT